jgi:hypothetical protein
MVFTLNRTMEMTPSEERKTSASKLVENNPGEWRDGGREWKEGGGGTIRQRRTE